MCWFLVAASKTIHLSNTYKFQIQSNTSNLNELHDGPLALERVDSWCKLGPFGARQLLEKKLAGGNAHSANMSHPKEREKKTAVFRVPTAVSGSSSYHSLSAIQ